jgi:CRP-like cAMP-binding protein
VSTLNDGQSSAWSRGVPELPELRAFLSRFPLRRFDPPDPLIVNTYRQPGAEDHVPRLAYVQEGLVRGNWHRSIVAPTLRVTAVVAGDRRWIGLDAFKYGENLIRYTALEPTTAYVVPLAELQQHAPREVLWQVLESASLDWCTAAAVVSLSRATLERRVLLLLFDVTRHHPRPNLAIPQQAIAELVGVSRQALSPVLQRLEARELIRLGYGRITVPDPARVFEDLKKNAADEGRPARRPRAKG